MSVEIYGSFYSTCTKRVLTALHFHGVTDFKFHDISFATGQHKSAEYLKIQPFGQVPALKHGDFVVFESRAIVKYIDDLYSAKSGKHLVPTDIKHKTLVEQWLSVDHDNYQPPVKGVVAEKMHWYGPNPDEEKVKANQQKALAAFDILEQHLSSTKSTFLVGSEFTAADLSYLPYTDLYYKLGGEFAAAIDSRPHVSAWWKNISANPAWVAASSAPPK